MEFASYKMQIRVRGWIGSIAIESQQQVEAKTQPRSPLSKRGRGGHHENAR
jgi:hypothetical protein